MKGNNNKHTHLPDYDNEFYFDFNLYEVYPPLSSRSPSSTPPKKGVPAKHKDKGKGKGKAGKDKGGKQQQQQHLISNPSLLQRKTEIEKDISSALKSFSSKPNYSLRLLFTSVQKLVELQFIKPSALLLSSALLSPFLPLFPSFDNFYENEDNNFNNTNDDNIIKNKEEWIEEVNGLMVNKVQRGRFMIFHRSTLLLFQILKYYLHFNLPSLSPSPSSSPIKLSLSSSSSPSKNKSNVNNNNVNTVQSDDSLQSRKRSLLSLSSLLLFSFYSPSFLSLFTLEIEKGRKEKAEEMFGKYVKRMAMEVEMSNEIQTSIDETTPDQSPSLVAPVSTLELFNFTYNVIIHTADVVDIKGDFLPSPSPSSPSPSLSPSPPERMKGKGKGKITALALYHLAGLLAKENGRIEDAIYCYHRAAIIRDHLSFIDQISQESDRDYTFSISSIHQIQYHNLFTSSSFISKIQKGKRGMGVHERISLLSLLSLLLSLSSSPPSPSSSLPSPSSPLSPLTSPSFSLSSSPSSLSSSPSSSTSISSWYKYNTEEMISKVIKEMLMIGIYKCDRALLRSLFLFPLSFLLNNDNNNNDDQSLLMITAMNKEARLGDEIGMKGEKEKIRIKEWKEEKEIRMIVNMIMIWMNMDYDSFFQLESSFLWRTSISSSPLLSSLFSHLSADLLF